MFTIIINGEEKKFQDELTIAELLDSLKIRTTGTAVAINDCIVPRSLHAETKIAHSDRIEIIQAFGGG